MPTAEVERRTWIFLRPGMHQHEHVPKDERSGQTRTGFPLASNWQDGTWKPKETHVVRYAPSKWHVCQPTVEEALEISSSEDPWFDTTPPHGVPCTPCGLCLGRGMRAVASGQRQMRTNLQTATLSGNRAARDLSLAAIRDKQQPEGRVLSAPLLPLAPVAPAR